MPMWPELELLHLEDNKKSISFFNIKKDRFDPYWHFHPEIELTLILQGTGIRYVGDSILPYSSGDLVMIGEYLPHHWVSDSFQENPCHAIVIHFNRRVFEKIHECSHFFPLFEASKRGIQFRASDALIKLFLNFSKKSRANRLASLITILDFLAIDPGGKVLSKKTYSLSLKRKHGFERSERVIKYILENLHLRLTVNAVAGEAHLTPQSFCRWFKKTTGHSFVDFVHRSRTENVCQLLLTKDAPVAEIAFECGFESISQFNRVFKKLKGMTATAFRNSELRG
ncbi:MAG: AraC family transcriptional regulator [Bacteroidota bacterium]